MARGTNIKLRNDVIYSVYVRNYGSNGTFKDVEEDLERIKALGVDIIWFMPIHPIGVKNKKGDLGCPYAIQDYRAVNPEYGTLDDFKALVDKIHALGMKCIIDVVYNHTSPDSVLSKNYPEYFFKKENGEFGNRVGDWTDIIDLNYNSKGLWEYQIEALKYWIYLGVDGFRCDVASLVPIDFWKQARQEVEEINKETIWLAESVHPGFIKYIRNQGYTAHSDCELYEAFDITYDYDVNEEYTNYFKGTGTLSDYIKKVESQETIYPENYIKLRFLENHDQPRAKKLIEDFNLLKVWTELLYFQKGTTLIYNGQEALEEKTPSLFDIDKINFHNINEELVELYRRLYKIKKKEIMCKGNYDIKAAEGTEVVIATYESQGEKLMGIFNLSKEPETVTLHIKDGEYTNLINDCALKVTDGKVHIGTEGIIFEV